MFWRFQKHFRIKKRLFLNLSKRSISLTYKGRLFRITWGKYGLRFTTGLRGTGLSATEIFKF